MTEASSSRKRRHDAPQSIYTHSAHLVGKVIRRKGKERPTNLEPDNDQAQSGGSSWLSQNSAIETDDDANEVSVDPYKKRTLAGWTTRRAREALGRWDLEPSRSPEPVHRLPDDDLLEALHRHATEFYSSRDLLAHVKKYPRAEARMSNKLRLLREEESDTPTSPSGTAGRTLRRGTSVSYPADGINNEDSDGDEIQGSDGEYLDSDDDKLEEDQFELQDEGENNPEDDAGEDAAESDNEGNTADQAVGSRRKGQGKKYRRRDMHRALDGSALLALGVLVEEHIISEIRRAGWAPQAQNTEDTFPTARVGLSLSPSMVLSESESEHSKTTESSENSKSTSPELSPVPSPDRSAPPRKKKRKKAKGF